MSLRIHNTLSKQKEPFETLEPGFVRLYVCGVTVYDSAHVGHAMSYLVFFPTDDPMGRDFEWWTGAMVGAAGE